jgi:flagellar hook-associated protein 2
VTNFAVDGIVSGMNTTQIVSQLMQVEALPQTALKTKVTTVQSGLTAWQSLNTRFASLKTASEVLGGSKLGDFFKPPTAWQSLGATSSNPTVVAAATTATTAGSITFDVALTARANSRVYAEVSGLTATAADKTAGLTFTVGGKPAVTVDLTDGSLSGVVSAINATKDLGVTAAAVQVRDGVFRLQLTATRTGEANGFTVTGIQPPEEKTTAGRDASIMVGGAGGYEVKSSSNTFTDVLPGVTFTVSAESTPGVTVTSARDAKGIADKMQSMIDAANMALADMDRVSAYNPTSKVSGALAGDASIRMLDGRVSGTVNQPANGKSMATIGVQLDRSGRLTFDKAVFQAALEKDPAAVEATATVLATRLTKVATDATAPSTGVITKAVDGQNSTIRSLNTRISEWDTRLEARRLSIQRQFTAMETALGKLKSQSGWLASQLSTLG